VDGVEAAVSGAGEDLFGLDNLDELGTVGIRFGVDDINAGGSQGGNNEVAPFQVRMGGKRAEGGATGVPPEVVELVILVREVQSVDYLAII
jgi:hypothetical protein